MLEASNLECVRGDRRLFAGVDFRLEGGEMLYLQGRNGSGKTSLLRMLCGLTPPADGEIRWRGTPVEKLADEFRAELCYLACRYLSQGQKRRVALARLVNERRALWILDEPYVALDTAAVELVAGLIGAHLQRGGLPY